MSENERAAQESFWKQHSQPTCEAMFLDSRAKDIDALDRPEILGALGSVADKNVLELGAGIGRLTTELMKDAKEVIACDFMENLVEQNRRTNGHQGNVKFVTQDVTQLQYNAGSLDVIFSNWLLMYLSDHEIEKLIKKSLSWLSEGGVLFFRESCYRQSGDRRREDNPTHYRDVTSYFAILDKVFFKSEDGKYYKYKLVNCANMKSYVQLKRNYGQIYWKFVKVEKEPDQVEFRHFLDHVQYSRNGILRYEKLFGHGFVSTGGQETTNQIISKFDLQPQQSVLDVGCGIGGGSFYLAKRFGVDVLGMDLSVNMVAIAFERACLGEYNSEVGHVTFEVSDCMTREFANASFDAIYSRDVILHIQDKPKLFKKMYEWLKPGGQVLITDYCRSAEDPSPGFAAYIKQRGYDLHSVAAYGQMLTDAGFEDVIAEDTTDSMFIPSLKRELKLAEDMRDSFLKDFTEEDFAAVVNGWKDKIVRANAGEQRWGLFYGKKPMH